MPVPQILADPAVFDVLEQASAIYRATVEDEDHVALPASSLSTLTLTLYVVKADGTIAYVNSRNAQNVLNANGVTVYNALQTRSDGTTYNLLWAIAAADTTLVEALAFERHIALFEWTWPTGKAGKHEVVLRVRGLTEVP